MLFKCSLQVLCRRLSRFNHSAEPFTQPFHSCLKPVLLLCRAGMKKAKILLSFSHVIRVSNHTRCVSRDAVTCLFFSLKFHPITNSIPSNPSPPIPLLVTFNQQIHSPNSIFTNSTSPPRKSIDLNPSPPIPLFIRTPINLIPYHQFHFLPAILPSKSHRLNSGPIQFHF